MSSSDEACSCGVNSHSSSVYSVSIIISSVGPLSLRAVANDSTRRFPWDGGMPQGGILYHYCYGGPFDVEHFCAVVVGIERRWPC